MKKKLFYTFFLIFILADACVERISLGNAEADTQLVVDGTITDEPGPYTVKLTRTQKLFDAAKIKTISAKSVSIIDNVGNSEVLKEVNQGEYQTAATGMRGVVGREYYVRIELRDGKIYESVPEKMNPAGSIQDFYWKFEQYQPTNGPTQYQFRFFIDANGNSEDDNLFRWKFNTTYLVETSPELHELKVGESTVPDPRSCSGHVFDGSKVFSTGEPCTCCTCWVTTIDPKPNVSSNQIYSGGEFKGVEVGAVPVEYWTFYEKAFIEITQMSLSSRASAYWKIVRDQKEGANTLFQPTVGKAISNIFMKNGSEEVQGYFSVSAAVKKSIFLYSRDIPLNNIMPSQPPPIKESCILAFKNSTNQKPSFWE